MPTSRDHGAPGPSASGPKPADSPSLLVPLLAMSAAQFATAFPLRLLPLLAPLAMTQAGLDPLAVGYLSSLAMVGAMVASLGTGHLVARLGPARTLTLAMGCATAAAAAYGFPALAAFALGSVLAGLADGLTPAAGNGVLQRYSPPGRRNLLFSVKMLGSPLGGLVAGLTLPLLVTARHWWLAPAMAVIVTALVLLAIRGSASHWPDLGAQGESARRPGSLREAAVWLSQSVPARRVALLGFFLAFTYGVWYAFYVTVLVSALGRTLIFAGAMMSLSLAATLVARLAIGFASDALGRAATLLLPGLSLASALPWAALALATTSTSTGAHAAMALAFGVTIGGWMGLQQAALARVAPAGEVDRVSGVSTFLMFVGLALSGVVFALFSRWTGGYRSGLFVIAASSGVVGLVGCLPAARRLWWQIRR